MWDPSGPGLEPVSPALAGGFLTTAPPAKSLTYFFLIKILYTLKLQITLVFFYYRNYRYLIKDPRKIRI